MARRPGIRPRRSLLGSLDAAARHAFPVGFTLLLAILGGVSLGLHGLSPALVLPCVFFWTVYRPAVMPPPTVLAIGLLSDLLSGAPLGVGAVTLLAAQAGLLRWRVPLARQGAPGLWVGFMGVALLVGAAGWLLTCLLTVRLLPLAPALWQALLTAALYPPLAWLFTRAHRAIAEVDGE